MLECLLGMAAQSERNRKRQKVREQGYTVGKMRAREHLRIQLARAKSEVNGVEKSFETISTEYIYFVLFASSRV